MKRSAIVGIADTVAERLNVCLGMAQVSDVVREIKKLLGEDASNKNIRLVLKELMGKVS